MTRAIFQAFSEKVIVFRDRRLPEEAFLAGYAALIAAYDVAAPLPVTLSPPGAKHRTYTRQGWKILTPRHAPAPTLEGHLVFALKKVREADPFQCPHRLKSAFLSVMRSACGRGTSGYSWSVRFFLS